MKPGALTAAEQESPMTDVRQVIDNEVKAFKREAEELNIKFD